jgi:uncharacterized protein (AIM24 family)
MSKYSIKNFVETTKQRDDKNEFFELETPHTLELNLNGKAWMKAGSMVAYTGNVKFERAGMLSGGLSNMFKKAISGEGMTLMSAVGNGRVYLADCGKKVRILHLDNEAIFVNGNDVLALEESIQYDIKMMRSVAGMAGGGLFNVRLSGTGLVAITTHYEPITLMVTPNAPVFTDPNATVAWSSGLTPEIKTDISFKTLLGRGSGESIQLMFKGDGWVVVQPYEEVYSAE